MGILTQSNNHIVPTNAYALLTGHPALPNRIQCALFKGTDTTEVIDMKDYSGSIYEQIDFAYKFVLRNIRLHASFESLERKETYENSRICHTRINCEFHCTQILY